VGNKGVLLYLINSVKRVINISHIIKRRIIGEDHRLAAQEQNNLCHQPYNNILTSFSFFNWIVIFIFNEYPAACNLEVITGIIPLRDGQILDMPL